MLLNNIDVAIDLIEKTNSERNFTNLVRRITKLFEEIGEFSEAFLNVTSSAPTKPKTWDDVKEEAIDILIVAVDIALTKMSEDDEEIETIKQKLSYSCRGSLYTIDGNFHTILWSIAGHVCKVGERTNSENGHKHAIDMVLNAFYLVDLVFKGQDRAIIKEMKRKLTKWKKNRKKKPDSDT